MGRTRKESGHAAPGDSRWPSLGGSIWVTLPGSVWATPGGSASPTPVAQYRVAADIRSTDGGESWSAVSAGLPNLPVTALAIDPQTPTILYAGTQGGGVYKSTDGGESWGAFNTGLTNLVVSSVV